MSRRNYLRMSSVRMNNAVDTKYNITQDLQVGPYELTVVHHVLSLVSYTTHRRLRRRNLPHPLQSSPNYSIEISTAHQV